MVRSLRQSWKTGRAWSYRFRIERWFRMRWCAAANRARWLPEPWFCYFGCPNCQPDFGEGQEGKRRYREWRAMEDELLAELAERSQSRTPGGPRPRVNERRVGDGASGSGVATGISPNPASRRPLGQAALARRSAPIRPSSGERALDGYVLLVVRAIAPFASGDHLVDVSSAQSRIAPSGSRSVTPSRRQLVFVGAGSRRRRCGRRGRKRLSARSVCMMTFGLIPHLVANLGEAARAVLEQARSGRRLAGRPLSFLVALGGPWSDRATAIGPAPPFDCENHRCQATPGMPASERTSRPPERSAICSPTLPPWFKDGDRRT
jgi:hypothetical protein